MLSNINNQYVIYCLLTILLIITLIYKKWELISPKYIESLDVKMANVLPYIGIDIHLKHISDSGQTHYLSLYDSKSCNLTNKQEIDCPSYVAVLSSSKNISSTFVLNSVPDRENLYTIVSKLGLKSKRNLKLSHGLNVSFGSEYICFENHRYDAVNLKIVAVDGGYSIQFAKPIDGIAHTYYVSMCDKYNDICLVGGESLKRLCITSDPTKALIFTIEF